MSIKTMFVIGLASAAVLSSCSDQRQLPDDVRISAAAGAVVEVGSFAPEFSLESAEGPEISLSGFRGTPVLLYFSMGPG